MAKQRGGLCGALIALVIGGIFFAIGYFVMYRPEQRAIESFVETQATVLDKQLGDSTGSKKNGRREKTFRPEIHIEYEVAGQKYDTWTYDMLGAYSSSRSSNQEILDRYQKNQQVTCWYDPEAPDSAVLVQGHSWITWIFLVLGGLVLLLGALGIGWYLFLAGVVVHAIATENKSTQTFNRR